MKKLSYSTFNNHSKPIPYPLSEVNDAYIYKLSLLGFPIYTIGWEIDCCGRLLTFDDKILFFSNYDNVSNHFKLLFSKFEIDFDSFGSSNIEKLNFWIKRGNFYSIDFHEFGRSHLFFNDVIDSLYKKTRTIIKFNKVRNVLKPDFTEIGKNFDLTSCKFEEPLVDIYNHTDSFKAFFSLGIKILSKNMIIKYGSR
ncbi:MAG: hypothetical protein COB02_00305 [Candidatus Cloacimonadota bacterium]|nr:MAG: hypothetical protein COB02_00305 [Candidatus Cloacimonadota bacterium]